MNLIGFSGAFSVCGARIAVRCYPQFTIASLALILLAGCGSAPREAENGAYIAPASINLRSQLNQKNSTVAVLKHGERVIVLDAHRRFVKVRTKEGAEGWIDAGDLLGSAEMERIRAERQRALELPSEGRATAYETLNIHLDPNRKSPAFAQIQEGAAVNVLARRVVPKNAAFSQPAFVLEKPKPATRRPQKERKVKAILKPPRPPAPKPPDNWQRMWAIEEPENSEASTPQKTKSPDKLKPAVVEDWTLIRTESNQTGWALARNLMMSIPDDVAQYAGGAHITSFFDLGTVHDERNGEKHNWLWTTASDADTADFDAWRVFLWNRRRHRFETSYRKRDVEGVFPVHVDPADPGSSGRTFKLITRDEDARLRRRTYLFDGTRVHLMATENYQPAETTDPRAAAVSEATASKSNAGWLSRAWTSWKLKWSGK